MSELRMLDKEATGKNIKRLMRKANLTTFDVQQKMGMTSPSTLYLWMRGEYVPNAENIVVLSQVLNCGVDDILVLEGEGDE